MNRVLGTFVGVLMLGVVTADAASIMTQETWTTSGAVGWTNKDNAGSPSAYGTLSNPGLLDGYLTIQGGLGDLSTHEDRIGTRTTSFLLGNYSNAPVVRAEFINFMFYASNYIPNTLSVYFQNDNGATTNRWQYDISSVAIGWNTYSVPLNWETGSGWFGGGLAFASDLLSVDEVGVILTYYNTGGITPGGQVYGLDDFGLGVPEPETYVLLGFALLSLCITFRRQVKSVIPALQKVVSG